MVTAICLNPSFDKTVEVYALESGKVNRILTSRTDVGGKGINVAVTAARLGIASRVIGCAGEDGVERIRSAMDRERVMHRFLEVPGSVRVNTKVVALDGGSVTELNEPGPAIDPVSLEKVFDMARTAAADSEYTVITGSLPPGCPRGTYRELIREMKGTRCILDVGGEELLLGAQAAPFLVKPNHHELAQTLGRELKSMADVIDAAGYFLDAGVTYAVVSLGKDGAVCVGREGVCYAPEITVRVQSTVGAGDAMVAGLAAGFMKTGNAREALRWGAAAGTASVMTAGTQLVQPDAFADLLKRAEVHEI